MIGFKLKYERDIYKTIIVNDKYIAFWDGYADRGDRHIFCYYVPSPDPDESLCIKYFKIDYERSEKTYYLTIDNNQTGKLVKISDENL